MCSFSSAKFHFHFEHYPILISTWLESVWNHLYSSASDYLCLVAEALILLLRGLLFAAGCANPLRRQSLVFQYLWTTCKTCADPYFSVSWRVVYLKPPPRSFGELTQVTAWRSLACPGCSSIVRQVAVRFPQVSAALMRRPGFLQPFPSVLRFRPYWQSAQFRFAWLVSSKVHQFPPVSRLESAICSFICFQTAVPQSRTNGLCVGI